MLGIGPGALCVDCHEPGSAGFIAASAMRDSIERLKQQLASAQTTVREAAQLGMDVSEAEFQLHEADTKLTQARTYVHSFSPSAMQPITQEGEERARQAADAGKQAVHEFHFRRHGLWITLLIIGFLIAGLLFKIREVERQRGPH
jgi:hypothetical protein